MQLDLTNLNNKVLLSVSLAQLPQLASAIGSFLQPGDWLFLDGDLGAGKTALSKEISLFFGVKNFFTSPTFSILNTEVLSKSKNNILHLVHLDLYRLKSGKELCYIGLEQEFNVHNSVVIIEWPDVLEKEEWDYFFTTTGCAKPKRILNIKIEGNQEERTYECSLLSTL